MNTEHINLNWEKNKNRNKWTTIQLFTTILKLVVEEMKITCKDTKREVPHKRHLDPPRDMVVH